MVREGPDVVHPETLADVHGRRLAREVALHVRPGTAHGQFRELHLGGIRVALGIHGHQGGVVAGVEGGIQILVGGGIVDIATHEYTAVSAPFPTELVPRFVVLGPEVDLVMTGQLLEGLDVEISGPVASDIRRDVAGGAQVVGRAVVGGESIARGQAQAIRFAQEVERVATRIHARGGEGLDEDRMVGRAAHIADLHLGHEGAGLDEPVAGQDPIPAQRVAAGLGGQVAHEGGIHGREGGHGAFARDPALVRFIVEEGEVGQVVGGQLRRELAFVLLELGVGGNGAAPLAPGDVVACVAGRRPVHQHVVDVFIQPEGRERVLHHIFEGQTRHLIPRDGVHGHPQPAEGGRPSLDRLQAGADIEPHPVLDDRAAEGQVRVPGIGLVGGALDGGGVAAGNGAVRQAGGPGRAVDIGAEGAREGVGTSLGHHVHLAALGPAIARIEGGEHDLHILDGIGERLIELGPGGGIPLGARVVLHVDAINAIQHLAVAATGLGLPTHAAAPDAGAQPGSGNPRRDEEGTVEGAVRGQLDELFRGKIHAHLVVRLGFLGVPGGDLHHG